MIYCSLHSEKNLVVEFQSNSDSHNLWLRKGFYFPGKYFVLSVCVYSCFPFRGIANIKEHINYLFGAYVTRGGTPPVHWTQSCVCPLYSRVLTQEFNCLMRCEWFWLCESSVRTHFYATTWTWHGTFSTIERPSFIKSSGVFKNETRQIQMFPRH